jgi:hypothetical protein
VVLVTRSILTQRQVFGEYDGGRLAFRRGEPQEVYAFLEDGPQSNYGLQFETYITTFVNTVFMIICDMPDQDLLKR